MNYSRRPSVRALQLGIFAVLLFFRAAAFASAEGASPCADLLTERMEREGMLRNVAHHMRRGSEDFLVFWPRVTRATNGLTIAASLPYVCKHLGNMNERYIVIGPRPRSNIPGVTNVLEQVPWAGFDQLGRQLVRLRDLKSGSACLLIVHADDLNLESGTPAHLRAWTHVRDLGEHLSAVRCHSVTLFTTYAALPTPEPNTLPSIIDRTGRPVRLRICDLTDRDGQPHRKIVSAPRVR